MAQHVATRGSISRRKFRLKFSLLICMFVNRYHIARGMYSTTLLSIEITLNNTTWLLGYLDTEHCIVSNESLASVVTHYLLVK